MIIRYAIMIIRYAKVKGTIIRDITTNLDNN
jgi:hypothetical protein